MKLNALRQEMESNPEFKKAKEELALHFELANAILKARLEKGWSQKQLANAIGTKQANISRIEAGLANPTISIIRKIFLHLGLEIKVIPFASIEIDLGVNKVSTINTVEVSTKAIRVPNWSGFEYVATYDTNSSSSGQKEDRLR